MIASVLLVLVLQSSSAAGLQLLRIEPVSIEPYQPVVLDVAGSGFSPSCKVMIEKRGRFVPVKTEYVDTNMLRAVLTAGLGPEPALRSLAVKCGRDRSVKLDLHVVAVAKPEQAVLPDQRDDSSEKKDAAPLISGEPAVVNILDPASVAAGEVFTLTLMGRGFVMGATVEVVANANAGTSHSPRYEKVEFEAEFASESVLIVDFARGFAPSPRIRKVIVRNPDGSESLPAYLKIKRRSP